jgi:hypothetical protein
MPRKRPHRRILAVLFPVTLALLSPGCRCAALRDAAVPGAGGSHTYTVRAEILRLPDRDRPGAEVVVRHEAIDDFVDEWGTVVGMDAMEMSFPAGPGLVPEGFGVGERVSLRFTVDYSAPSLTVERLERLPPGTALRFEPAHPRAGRDTKP